jgi:hypothetical protein
MLIKTKIAALLGIAALMLAPTAAFAGGPEYAPEKPPKTKPMPGPSASMPEKAKAYGVYCAGFPKKPVKGQAMTPFSRCVTAMASAATSKKTAQLACKAFPKTHVKGQAGTEYSRCVTAAAKVKKKVAAS